jgi:hypothetical protein
LSTSVSATENLFDFFHAEVELASEEVGHGLSQDTNLYLASLLSERARTDRPAPQIDTLAELHAVAAGATPAVQARTYRELGDRALYVLGYFRKHLQRRSVGPSYYEDMGSAAYHQVDTVFKRWFADAFGPVFGELAVRFPAAAAVLERVREKQEGQPDTVERLYRQWLETGDEDVASRLRRLGLLVPRRGGSPAEG